MPEYIKYFAWWVFGFACGGAYVLWIRVSQYREQFGEWPWSKVR